MFVRRCARLALLLWVFVVTGCTQAPAQDSGGPLLPEQAAYDVTHYDLALRVDPGAQTLEGRLGVRAAVTDSLDVLVLDLDHRLAVNGAWWGPPGDRARALSVDRRAGGNQLWIDLPRTVGPGETITATVAYGGTPREAPNPPWRGGLTWATTPGGAPWVATSGQTAGADLWWPVKDHPSDEPDSMDIAFTVPDSLVAASNGVLRGVERASDSTTTYRWHVSTPINTYGVTLNAAPYVRIDTTYASTAGVDVPVSFYALPSDAATARRHLPDFLRHVRFLEKTLGPYPFRADKYGIAQTPFLGMEHQTLIAYGNAFGREGGLGYEAPFDALHFHELAHEWYGNCLTVRDWKDFWLHEGTATYLEALYTESLAGTAAYHDRIDYFRRQITARTAIARRQPASAQTMYGRDVYYKGAVVLHTLRSMIGADALETLLHEFVYPDGPDPATACRPVDTEAFLRRAEAVAGRSLDGFADTYLYRAALPRLDTTRADGRLTLRWTRTGEGAFEVPMPVRVGDSLRTVAMEGGTGTLSVPTGAEIQIDPTGWVLREKMTQAGAHQQRRRPVENR